MLIKSLITLFFSIGFFFESIFGFGGGLIAYSLLGFFIDLKIMVLAGLYIGTLSSTYIALSGKKYIDVKIFYKIIPVTILGSIIGAFAFLYLPERFLLLFFASILLFLASKIIFFDNYKFPKFLKYKLLFVGAISQGAFGVGGPFIVNAMSNDFKCKSSLRSNMALYFIFCNVIRIVQILTLEKSSLNFLYEIWWIIIPVFLAIYLGHFVHLKIKDNYFKKGVAIITLLASINFVFKALK